MSMHMIRGVQVHGVGKRCKAKQKSIKLLKAEAEHEKFLKKLGVRKSGGDYRHDLPTYDCGPRMTSDKIANNGIKRDTTQYTGDYIIGIGTMHKSNMVPITRKEDAIAIAQMRR